ncbi:MAG TPA: bifunctional 4-hydroxy-2-oxoglutarate aldolase/2-dehydro-3-deoxy-phosphogluconate aldolase [Puia sp.]|jgi:2-dehydro-3-deoxyphosphogluconate aldolase/(4S)-4-hydroxy-2-oxoglutarate aldolase
MYKKEEILQAILDQAVLPLYFHPDAERSVEIMKSLYAAGIRIIEYTNRGPSAIENLKSLKLAIKKDCKGMMLAAGTITDGKTAELALNAGADFLISPGFVKEVLAVSRKHDVLWIPGCMTPTELIKASHAEIRLVKLFPGSLLGPEFVSSVKDIFPDLMFMPTGGVEPTMENLRAWFGAGVSAVGMGSRLITKSIIDKKEFAELTRQTEILLNQIDTIRHS